jgi:hypothetical protein
MMIARRSADCGLLAINPCSHQQMPLKSASGTSAAIVRGSEIEGRNHRDEKSAILPCPPRGPVKSEAGTILGLDGYTGRHKPIVKEFALCLAFPSPNTRAMRQLETESSRSRRPCVS